MNCRTRFGGSGNFVWKLKPEANELIYDNYNALAFGWSVPDRLGQVFFTIGVPPGFLMG